jgi:hypothetical protein
MEKSFKRLSQGWKDIGFEKSISPDPQISKNSLRTK